MAQDWRKLLKEGRSREIDLKQLSSAEFRELSARLAESDPEVPRAPPWRELVEMGHYADIDWSNLPRGDRAEYLAKLRTVVPLKHLANGIQKGQRYMKPDELNDPHLQAAAETLDRGELEYAVEGREPSSFTEAWPDIRKTIEKEIAASLAEDEVTEGAPEFSSHRHAEIARDCMEHIDFLRAHYIGQEEDEDRRRLLDDSITEAVYTALHLGRRLQAASNKPWEVDALRGLKTIRSAGEGGAAREGYQSDESKEVLAEMGRILEEQKAKGDRPNISKAALIAHKRGCGTSQEANRQLWKRDRKKKLGHSPPNVPTV